MPRRCPVTRRWKVGQARTRRICRRVQGYSFSLCRYTRFMIEWRRCWVCELCGFAWIKSSETPPAQCVSGRCRSRKWNASGKQGADPVEMKTGAATTPPSKIAPALVEVMPPAAPVPTLPVVPASQLPVPVPRSRQPRTVRRQVSPVRPDQSKTVAPRSDEMPAKFIQLAAMLEHPHKVGEQCAHGWASWFQCPTCNPRR
jgi:hypothetical protein